MQFMPDRILGVKKYKQEWWLTMLWDDADVTDERLQKWLAPQHEAIVREWVDGGGKNIPVTWCGYKEDDENSEDAESKPEFEEEGVKVRKTKDQRREQADESEEEDEDDEDDDDEEFKPEFEEEEEVLSRKRKRRGPNKKSRKARKVIHLNYPIRV
jgi:hypothetical protein